MVSSLVATAFRGEVDIFRRCMRFPISFGVAFGDYERIENYVPIPINSVTIFISML